MLFGRGRLSPALEGGPFSPRAVVSDRSNLDDQPPERKERTVDPTFISSLNSLLRWRRSNLARKRERRKEKSGNHDSPLTSALARRKMGYGFLFLGLLALRPGGYDFLSFNRQ